MPSEHKNKGPAAIICAVSDGLMAPDLDILSNPCPGESTSSELLKLHSSMNGQEQELFMWF